jgi:hypothetical protein
MSADAVIIGFAIRRCSAPPLPSSIYRFAKRVWPRYR